jgi:hypothetical protein
MCSANKQEPCSVAGFANEDPKKVPSDVCHYILIKHMIGTIEAAESGSSRLLVALQ